MRTGKYEASERGSCVGTAVTFLLIGLGAGALTALLLAPKSGRRLRKDIGRRYRDARDAFENLKDDARDMAEDAMERGSDLADDIRDKVTPLGKAFRRS
jgi:gas vesicle protein